MNEPGRAPGGRSVHEEVRKRRAEIAGFADLVLTRHISDSQILIVAHGNLIRFLVSTLAGVNPKRTIFFETNYASITEVVIEDGQFCHVAYTNDAHHLLPHQILYRI
ncbi:histidine phosphatase family protein [Candidatus Latescibacterota bacterium]